jgi:purine-nucleoside phosphorylase
MGVVRVRRAGGRGMTDAPVGVPGPGDLLAEKAVAVIRERTDLEPVAGIVLGSGLGSAIEGIHEEAAFSYEGLPGFPVPTVPGHSGRLVLGRFAGVPVAAFLGRIHYYEGHPMALASLPVRVAHLLGATTMIVTASAGSLDPSIAPGAVVVASDHINMMGENPLRGWRRPDGSPPFVDMTDVYDPALAEIAVRQVRDLGGTVERGVYLAASGPTYETPAEIDFMRRAGGTVVGMSVVPEAVPARALGMKVLGLFSVTNATGVHVSHVDVVRIGSEVGMLIGRLLERLLPQVAAVAGAAARPADEE